jgi:dolichyl-phosphate beta-glucosyltransferase
MGENATASARASKILIVDDKIDTLTLMQEPPQTQTCRLRYSIIVPAYNESRRISQTLENIVSFTHAQSWNAEVLAVDDGSSDGTPAMISEFAAAHPEVRLLCNPGNRGKGFAVRNGMMNARGDLLLFTDADLSSPIAEAAKLFAALEQGADVAIGSRWLDASLQFVRQPLRRRIFSRSFNLFIKLLLGLPFRDTQCGFKAFTRPAAAVIFPRQRIHRWGFDPEVIYIARRQGLKVTEVPVAWGHDERSTIHPFRDGLRMGIEALKIRWYAWMGKYRG